MSDDNFRLFYQIQYDRIEHLETKRENFSNFIITISSVLLGIGFNNSQAITLTNKNVLLLFVVLTNILVIVFIAKTRRWIKMHQSRANDASKIYAPKFNEIKESVGKAESDDDFFRRSRIYTYVHIIIISITTLLALIDNKICFCN